MIALRNIATCCSVLALLACRSEPAPAPVEHALPILAGDRGSVARVVVTELRDSVYYADLVLARADDEVTVSSRPSDAIALAARMDAPIFATPEVLEDAGIEIRDEDEEAEIEKFREFLDEITPEDFEAGESAS